jgi:type II secretory pathway pseudopilin PulG
VVRRQQGFALLAALVAVLLLAIALALVAESLALRLRLVRQEQRTIALGALSDAALAEALAHLAHDHGFRGLPAHAFAGGTLASEVLALDSEHFAVTATATLAGHTRAVEAAVALFSGSPRVVHWRRLPGG